MRNQSWYEFIHYFQQYSLIISLFLNILQIWLILNKSPKKIGSYKYLMVYISIFEILYSIVDAITKPFVHSYTSRVIVIVDAQSYDGLVSKSFYEFILAVMCSFYGSSISLFALNFMYRYGSLESMHRPFFEGWRMWVLCSVPIWYGVIWGSTIVFMFPKTPEFAEFIRQDLRDYFNLDYENIVYIASYYYAEDAQGVHEFVWIAFFGMCILWFILGSSIFTMFYYGMVCYRTIRKLQTSYSKSQKSLQKQLFYALALQATIPCVFLYIPCSVAFVCPIFLYNLGSYSSFVSVSIALYPAIDPLPNLIIIQSYRLAIRGFFENRLRKCGFRIEHVTKVQSTSTPNSQLVIRV